MVSVPTKAFEDLYTKSEAHTGDILPTGQWHVVIFKLWAYNVLILENTKRQASMGSFCFGGVTPLCLTSNHINAALDWHHVSCGGQFMEMGQNAHRAVPGAGCLTV